MWRDRLPAEIEVIEDALGGSQLVRNFVGMDFGGAAGLGAKSHLAEHGFLRHEGAVVEGTPVDYEP